MKWNLHLLFGNVLFDYFGRRITTEAHVADVNLAMVNQFEQ